ncbi:hypothetical protein FIBSPDRAFT_930274 [Athelia psychrophila]|uniref:Uncharacterized protein n=1 Tax=Athelia psychrophila TaxID=1759441 RepID=A0A166M9C9_9AGAM|nr:hypothetical protein FIBSPDRAFT_930274 [Fibularhizoctonia sp. CBS 109695]
MHQGIVFIQGDGGMEDICCKRSGWFQEAGEIKPEPHAKPNRDESNVDKQKFHEAGPTDRVRQCQRYITDSSSWRGHSVNSIITTYSNGGMRAPDAVIISDVGHWIYYEGVATVILNCTRYPPTLAAGIVPPYFRPSACVVFNWASVQVKNKHSFGFMSSNKPERKDVPQERRRGSFGWHGE